jgi:hypothetical protein
MTPGLLGSWKPGLNETQVPFGLAQDRLSTPLRFAPYEQDWLRVGSPPSFRQSRESWLTI